MRKIDRDEDAIADRMMGDEETAAISRCAPIIRADRRSV